MPLRCSKSGKGAVALVTEELIDMKGQMTLLLEFLHSLATVWDK